MMARDWMIGGVSFSETPATALGIPHVVGVAEGISRARQPVGALEDVADQADLGFGRDAGMGSDGSGQPRQIDAHPGSVLH